MRHGKISVWHSGNKVNILSGMQTQSLKERLCGLLVLEPLKPQQALWLTPCNSIHTVAMKYDLDLIYLDRHNTICKLVENVKPWRVSGCLKAKVTIELQLAELSNLEFNMGIGANGKTNVNVIFDTKFSCIVRKIQLKKIQTTLNTQVEADNFYAQGDCENALPLYHTLSEAMSSDTQSLLRIGNCYAKVNDFSRG